MADKHEFFPQPRGNPWCFCRDRDCPGWVAYVAWHQADTGEDSDPDHDAIKAHRRIATLLADLTRYYGALFGVEVDIHTALDLMDIDRAARPRGRARPS
jgi:hypothetical protein